MAERIPGHLCVTTHPPGDHGTLRRTRHTPPAATGCGAGHEAMYKRVAGPLSKVPGMTAAVAKAALLQARDDAIFNLEWRAGDMKTWDDDTQHHFESWFGTTSLAARKLIAERIDLVLAKMRAITIDDFVTIPKPERGHLSRSRYAAAVDDYEGTFASVVPNQLHPELERTIRIGPFFAWASRDDRAGTLVHELSHFYSGGRTHDVKATYPGDTRTDKRMYGQTKALRLAGQGGDDPARNPALDNADNFAYFIERCEPADHLLDVDGAGDWNVGGTHGRG